MLVHRCFDNQTRLAVCVNHPGSMMVRIKPKMLGDSGPPTHPENITIPDGIRLDALQMHLHDALHLRWIWQA
jgi:hypothetical protein